MATNIEYLHADQIGGCVTLISTETTKICIDFGKNLPGSRYKEDVEVVGLTSGEAQYDAVFFTHYHGDHIGCFEKLLPEIPLYMSSLCRDVLINTYAALARHDNKYSKQKGAEYYKEDLARLCTQYPTVQLYTSGHASKNVIEAIIRLVDAQDYTAVIHSERAELIDRSSFC